MNKRIVVTIRQWEDGKAFGTGFYSNKLTHKGFCFIGFSHIIEVEWSNPTLIPDQIPSVRELYGEDEETQQAISPEPGS